MRHPSPVALCLLAALPLTAAGAPASAGTPEEQALRTALTGKDAEAVTLLARSGDPELTWLAGRYALETGDFTTAGRLLSGTEPRQTWGQIDLRAARGDYAGALAVALPELDAAMAGTHRDAMAKLLIGWATERMKAAPAGEPDTSAVAFLDAATSIGPSQSPRTRPSSRASACPRGTATPAGPGRCSRVPSRRSPTPLGSATGLQSRRRTRASRWRSLAG